MLGSERGVVEEWLSEYKVIYFILGRCFMRLSILKLKKIILLKKQLSVLILVCIQSEFALLKSGHCKMNSEADMGWWTWELFA